MNPILPLFPFQQRFIDDPSRLKAWLKSRQVGGSTVCTADVVLDVVSKWDTPSDWNMMSRSQRQAKKLLEKAKRHTLAINRYMVEALRKPPIIDPRNIGTERLQFNNGAVIEAMPCDPDTTVGDTVNWLLDEYDLYMRQREIFAIIKPSIMHGKRMVIVSSPRRRDGHFAEIVSRWQREGYASGWSLHTTTIADAIADGLSPKDHNNKPLSFEQFKAQEIRDIGLEMWQQEYMCQFIDTLSSYIPWSLVDQCQHAGCGMERTFESLSGELYVGVDVGRTHDLTCVWIVSRKGDGYFTEAVYTTENVGFEADLNLLRSVLGTKLVAGLCIDITEGKGSALAEQLDRTFPGVVESVTMTNPTKAEIAGRVKAAMQSGEFLIPRDGDIAADFTSVQKSVTDAGNIRLAAPRTGIGHGDRFWAACLAVHAAATHQPFELVLAG